MRRKYREASESTKAKLSAKKSGVNNPMYSKKHSEETKKLISKALKKYWATVPSSKT